MIVAIHDRAITDFKPLPVEMLTHSSKDLFAYAVFFVEVTELTNGCLVRGCFYGEVDPNKFAHSLAIIEAVFSLWVQHFEPLLQEVDPEHSLYGWATSLTRGIIGLDQAGQFPPRDNGLHLAQKVFTPCLLMVSLKINTGKGHLKHGNLAHRLNQIRSDLPTSED